MLPDTSVKRQKTRCQKDIGRAELVDILIFSVERQDIRGGNMKITRKQLKQIISEALSETKSAEMQDAIVFLEYLEGFISRGSLSPDPHGGLTGRESSLTVQELLQMIPGFINQINLALGGKDTGAQAAEIKDTTYSAVINPAAGTRSVQRPTAITKHNSLTLVVPILLQEGVTLKHKLKGYEWSGRSFVLHIYIPFDGRSSHMTLQEDRYSGVYAEIIDMRLDESRFDFALEILEAANDPEAIGEFIADAAADYQNLPIYSI